MELVHAFPVVLLLLSICQVCLCITCLSCGDEGQRSLSDCSSVMNCAQNQTCFVEQVLSLSDLSPRFKAGCRDMHLCNQIKCSSALASNTPSVFRRDLTVCTKCCYKDICNVQGCGGALEKLTSRGDHLLQCFTCTKLRDSSPCKQFTTCQLGELCSSEYRPHGEGDPYYHLGCMSHKYCEILKEMALRDNTTLNIKCCNKQLCNQSPFSVSTGLQTSLIPDLTCPPPRTRVPLTYPTWVTTTLRTTVTTTPRTTVTTTLPRTTVTTPRTIVTTTPRTTVTTTPRTTVTTAPRTTVTTAPRTTVTTTPRTTVTTAPRTTVTTTPKTTIVTTKRTSISSGQGPICLTCKGIVQPRHCHTVVRCHVDQSCGIQKVVDQFGDALYDIGCTDNHICKVQSPSRSVPCKQCCSTDLCNVRGCGVSGYPDSIGSVCFTCASLLDGRACHKISICQNSQVCYSTHTQEFGDIVVERGCIDEQSCQAFTGGTSSMLIGRRSISSLQSNHTGPAEVKDLDRRATDRACCCRGSLCNEKNHQTDTCLNI